MLLWLHTTNSVLFTLNDFKTVTYFDIFKEHDIKSFKKEIENKKVQNFLLSDALKKLFKSYCKLLNLKTKKKTIRM